MIRLEIGLEIRHHGVMSLCAITDKPAIVVVASYRSVSRNPSFQGPEIDVINVKNKRLSDQLKHLFSLSNLGPFY